MKKKVGNIYGIPIVESPSKNEVTTNEIYIKDLQSDSSDQSDCIADSSYKEFIIWLTKLLTDNKEKLFNGDTIGGVKEDENDLIFRAITSLTYDENSWYFLPLLGEFRGLELTERSDPGYAYFAYLTIYDYVGNMFRLEQYGDGDNRYYSIKLYNE